ncbi:ly6/PLAUR domain-containing protein 8 [Choloepus didactylus]|uniref:ly6/PLAUR domain-containing protein 8 n=1 Tax=Choloepus didactylus TaxID=27675 RepID=UPI0018A12390|nr:ly6/PLAUR domain-containing protein 8 [Choloepus didactylus]
MKAILIAAVITALAVEAVESLGCVQYNSWNTTNANSNAASPCPQEANISCTSSLMNSTLGGTRQEYVDKSCSAEQCDLKEKVVAAFTVQVSDEDLFQFASLCCTDEGCNTKDASVPPMENISRTVECPACYGSDEASCSGQARKCNTEERCVSLVAEFSNGSASEILVLKGCSNVSNETCVYLSAANRTVGGIVFRNFECSNSTLSNLTSPSPTTTTTTTTSNTSKFSFTPVALASLLLLGLLL